LRHAHRMLHSSFPIDFDTSRHALGRWVSL
jgi:hypothetical protein